MTSKFQSFIVILCVSVCGFSLHPITVKHHSLCHIQIKQKTPACQPYLKRNVIEANSVPRNVTRFHGKIKVNTWTKDILFFQKSAAKGETQKT
jgi:hypothetical protein